MEMGAKTPFHDTAQQFIQTIDGSRRVFSSLVDFFSAMAAQDYANDWAPEWAARCFKFNKAQKKFQRDFREWADSITEEDVKLVRRLFGGVDEPAGLRQGGPRPVSWNQDVPYQHVPQQVVQHHVVSTDPYKVGGDDHRDLTRKKARTKRKKKTQTRSKNRPY